MSSFHVYPGDSLAVLPTFPVNTFDALITDPPASIGFMGQAWDGRTLTAATPAISL